MTGAYRIFAAVLAGVIMVLGLVMIGFASARGGSTSGFLIGALFTALGSGRLYLLFRR